MSRFVFCFAIIFLFFSCNTDKTAKAPASEEAAAPAPAPAPPAATLPSVPLEILQKIYQKGTQVDFIYYNYPFTSSLSEKPAIQNATRHIAETPAPLDPNCKTAGRVTYQVDGDIVLEGDFYFSTGCTYFVFYENQKKKYSNYMTDEGVNFFNTQIQQALKLRTNVQQQQ
ncbi:MAG TPA: hypothetical protein ENJ95_06475 [Bacteroidetes bacterium]|nr:hypothetical protein [Bacteroidota bacterium]